MEGVPVTVEDVKGKRYPLVRPFLFILFVLFITNGPYGEHAQAYIDCTLSK